MRVFLRLAALALLMGGVVSATEQSFTATLTPIKITVRPGEVVTRYFELTLGSDRPRAVFNARVEDWWRSEDGTQTFYGPAGRLSQSCGSWVTLNPVEAAVDPGKTLRIRVTVSVPEKVSAGGYWCALTVDEIPDPSVESAGGVEVRFLASMAVGIFVYIEPVQRAIEILDVDVSSKAAHARVRVLGNTPVAIEGRVEFTAPSQKAPTATIAFPRTTVLTEPARVGVVRVDLPSATDLPSGRYLVRVILDVGLDHYIGVEREIDLRRDADDED